MPAPPTFLGPLASPGGPAPGFAGAPRGRNLTALRLSPSGRTNWCWAAVTQAVLRFRQQREVPQVEIASEHMRRTGKGFTCEHSPRREEILGLECGTPCRGSCNDMHFLRIILHEHNCLRHAVEGAPALDLIRGEIQNDRPLPCRIQWRPNGGHFVLVAGWSEGADGRQHVRVLDPAANEGSSAISDTIMPYDDFVRAYRRSDRIGAVNFHYLVT